MGLGDIFSYLEDACNGIYSDIKVVIAQATTGDRKSDDLGAIKNDYKNSIKQLVEKNEESLKTLTAKGEKVAGQLEEIKENLKKSKQAEQMLAKYKQLKKEADLSNAENVKDLRDLIEKAYNLSKQELIEWKATMDAAVKVLSSIDSIQNVIDIRKYLNVSSNDIDKIKNKMAELFLEFNAILKRTIQMLTGLDCNGSENDINKIIATKEVIDITGEFDKLKEDIKKLINVTISGITEKTASDEKSSNCCLYSKTFCCLLSGVCGVKTPENLKVGKETSDKEKNYVKTFGYGYIAKGMYTAIAKACQQTKIAQAKSP